MKLYCLKFRKIYNFITITLKVIYILDIKYYSYQINIQDGGRPLRGECILGCICNIYNIQCRLFDTNIIVNLTNLLSFAHAQLSHYRGKCLQAQFDFI